MKHIIAKACIFFISALIAGCGSNLESKKLTPASFIPLSFGPDATPPSIVSVSPANGDRDVSPSSTISITFSETMNPTTITTNVGSTTCTGSLQVSFDDFTTCVEMNVPPDTTDNITFTLTPSADLDTGTLYKIKVLASVQDHAGNPMAADYTTSIGFVTEINGSAHSAVTCH